MKKFSAKNANFDNLTVNNSAAISSADLGTAPNQIPLNKDLGSLAYQDAVNLDDVSADMLELRAIAAEISDSAVDVFVYDTSRDSDGGAWRKRTQHTSWYNEELNTATRGGRREFPAVAVIVAEAGKVTIYDGDDPDLSMWMVFSCNISFPNYGLYGTNVYTVSGLNGTLAVGSTNRIHLVNFVTDEIRWASDSTSAISIGISNREGSANVNQVTSGFYLGLLVNTIVNDVAMTILPNAPIDQNTGLPVPTIAVATAGGVSVIKDDGTVVDLNVLSRPYSSVYFSGNMVWAVENPETNYDLLRYFEIPTSDITTASSYGPNSSPALFPENTKGNIFDSFNYGSPIGITKLNHEGSMVAYTTSKYNTGWMPGDIKLATLSDTTVETIGESSDNLFTGDNSTFDSSVGDWGGVHAILSVDANRLKVTNSTSTDAGSAYLDVDTVVGARYSLEVSIDIGTSPEASLLVYNGAGFTDQNTFVTKDTSGTYYLQFNAESSTSRIVFANNSVTNGHYSFFDNVSLKQTTELVTNGDFSTNVTASDGQTSGGWTSNKAELSIESGRLKIVDAGSSSAAYQAINTIAGKKYVLSLSGQFNDGSDGNIQVRDATFSGTTLNSIDPVGLHETPTEFSLTFVAQSSTTIVRISPASTSSFIATIDNVSVRPAEADRSVNNNGLQIVGAINKTPVAPGADLVAYSGFSDNNYLVQPYNEDLNFGSGDYCFMLWQKGTDSVGTFVTIHDNSSVDPGDALWIGQYSANTIWFSETQSGVDLGYTGSSSANAPSIDDNVWNFWCFIKRSGNLEFWHNGMFIESRLGHPNLSIPSGKLFIGNDGVANNGQFYNPGELALLRISKTAPTAEQIAKIYRDEKVLFTDGAQATLYGTSDAVTALSYDQKTELLHVGTASGRSDFSGLRRINNTTTAITTSISAHNNLIAEQ